MDEGKIPPLSLIFLLGIFSCFKPSETVSLMMHPVPSTRLAMFQDICPLRMGYVHISQLPKLKSLSI